MLKTKNNFLKIDRENKLVLEEEDGDVIYFKGNLSLNDIDLIRHFLGLELENESTKNSPTFKNENESIILTLKGICINTNLNPTTIESLKKIGYLD